MAGYSLLPVLFGKGPGVLFEYGIERGMGEMVGEVAESLLSDTDQYIHRMRWRITGGKKFTHFGCIEPATLL